MSMNKDLVYISDFFVEQILGGGELNDNELIQDAADKKIFSIEKIQSHAGRALIIWLKKRRDSFFIISNFCNLNQEPCKDWLIE
jgi:hypothetical protein